MMNKPASRTLRTLIAFAEFVNRPRVLAALCMLGALAGFLWVGPVHAQSLDLSPYTISNLQNQAQAGDVSMRWLSGLLGESFLKNPLIATGVATTTLGKIIFSFNASIFVLVVGFLSYSGAMSIVNAAEKGDVSKVLGSWSVLRRTGGLFFAAPAFQGYSLIQAIYACVIVIGINLANLAAGTLWQSADNFQPLVPSSASVLSVPNLASDFDTIAHQAFALNLCALAEQNHQSNELGVPAPLNISTLAPLAPPTFGDAASGVSTSTSGASNGFGGIDYGECGKIVVQSRAGSSTASDSSAATPVLSFGYLSPVVDYAAIASAVQNSAAQQLQSVQSQALALARQWLAADQAGQPMDAAAITSKLSTIALNARTGLNGALQSTSADHAQAINQQGREALQNGGWMMLGTSAEIFSAMASGVADAQRAVQIQAEPGVVLQQFTSSKGMNASGQCGDFDQIVCQEIFAYALADAEGSPQQTESLTDKVLDIVTLGQDVKTPLGNRSFGQTIASEMINLVAANSGGAGMVDPLVASKNLGDYMADIGGAGLSIASVVNLADAIPTGPMGTVKKMFLKPLSGLLGAATTAFAVMLGLGLFLSVYIPLIPFLCWFSACLTYFRIALEGFVNAQIGALMHILAPLDGEGITGGSPGAQRVWQQLFQVLFWPVAMVIAFTFALILMRVSDTFLLQVFPTVMAAAQGNGLAGLPTAVAFLAVFCFVSFGLVQTCSNLIVEIPMSITNWIGMHLGAVAASGSAMLGAAIGSALRSSGASAGNAIASGSKAGAATTPAPAVPGATTTPKV